MKKCSSCFEDKDISGFYKHPLGRDGHFNSCKVCMIEKTMAYAKTPAGKASHQRAEKRHVEKYRIRYRVKWQAHSAASYLRHLIRHQARNAVGAEVRAGRLPKAVDCPCTNCGELASQYHHWRGYAKQFWLDVIPLCLPCHSAA